MIFQQIHKEQQEFFHSQKTKSIKYRKMQLELLRDVIKKREKEFYTAIDKDFGKSEFDTYTTEISFLYNDIEFYLKNLNRLAQPKRVKTNLANQLGKSSVIKEPLGNVLVIGAWNYPYQLTLSPAIAAIAAGNTVIVKPSEIASHTSRLMVELINSTFSREFLYALEGDAEITSALLKLKFDKIFFTGSTRVGKIIYEAAAKQLTPVTLELGGKSPVIVSEYADVDLAAKRIVWGKFINGGQTCVAPDYILVDKKVQGKFLEHLRRYIDTFAYKVDSPHYSRIINDKNFQRLVGLIDSEKIYCGGGSNPLTRFIEPTVLFPVAWEDKVMEDEIFGPILPVLSFHTFSEALHAISQREKPLAAYLFSNNSKEKKAFSERISFGGGCINEVVMHLSNEHLPFGGVGNSGMGNYHGVYGFDTFSHEKAILDRMTWGEPPLRYPPYTDSKLNWIKRLL